MIAGCYSSVGSDVALESRGTAIDPHVLTSFREDLVMKIFSTAILPLPLNKEEHLSVNGEKHLELVTCFGEACLGTVLIG